MVPPADERAGEEPGGAPVLEPGPADVVTLERRKAAALSPGDEQSFFLDTVAEYQWAGDTASLAPATLDGLSLDEYRRLITTDLADHQVSQVRQQLPSKITRTRWSQLLLPRRILAATRRTAVITEAATEPAPASPFMGLPRGPR